jgi:hypothetical protein
MQPIEPGEKKRLGDAVPAECECGVGYSKSSIINPALDCPLQHVLYPRSSSVTGVWKRPLA